MANGFRMKNVRPTSYVSLKENELLTRTKAPVTVARNCVTYSQ